MKMELCLRQDSDDILILRIKYPKEAMFTIDEKTGEMIPSETDRLMIIRDYDLDGVPDDFFQTGGIQGRDISDDDFIPYQNKAYYRAILITWSMGIGYSVNYFLHDIESALPSNR